MKQILKQVLEQILKLDLMLHNLTYRIAGYLATRIEGGVHPKHRLLGYHQWFVDHIKETDTVLDVGCGKGFLTRDLAKKAKFVCGLDISRGNLSYANSHYIFNNIKYVCRDARELEEGKYDVVVLSNVLEHIGDRGDFLRCMRLTAPKILIRVPLIDRDWITLYKKELNMDYRLDKGHYIEYTEETLKKELEEADMKLSEYKIQYGELWGVVGRC